MADAFAENVQFAKGDGSITGDFSAGGNPNPAGGSPEQTKSPEQRQRDGILQQARMMISESTDFYQSSFHRQWSRNLSNFQSKHPAGSKYHAKSYKMRSRSFRPKTRATVRKNEAAASTAFFSTADPVAIQPTSQADESQVASAAVWQSVLRHRMKYKMPWFQTLIGSYQDTQVMGACVSHNYWKFETDDEDNVIHDDLACDLIPLQNFRVHPKSDWRNAIEDSPYLIHIYSMVVDDVKLKMENGEWHQCEESQILAAVKDWDEIEAKQDEKTAHLQATGQGIRDHESVWVCKIIQRHRGKDYCYFVLGEHHLLTDPVPLSELTPGGMRNYTMGVCNIETHKTIPSGPVEMYQGVQSLTNDIANQRLDNVKLSMNGRFLMKRQANMDHRALTQSVPGGVVVTDDPEKDLQHLQAPDVTSSSYQEQNYISADFDEIAGNFSQSSVNTNRKMGETVGGMELLTGESNMMMEYQLRVFSETWVKPTIKQFLQLEQAYETDMTLKVLAANENIDLLQKYGINEITDELLDQELTCEVSVGIDATNPDRRMQRLMAGVNTMMTLGVPPNTEEINKEVWGILGMGDGSRFVSQEEQPPSPEQVAMEADAQKAQADAESKMIDAQTKQQVAQMTLQREQLALQREVIQSQDVATQSQAKRIEMEAKLDEAHKKYSFEFEKLQADLQKAKDQIASNEAIAVLNDTTKRLQIGVDAENKEADRLDKKEIEGAKLQEQARESDEARAEQSREFNEGLKADKDSKDADRKAMKQKSEGSNGGN